MRCSAWRSGCGRGLGWPEMRHDNPGGGADAAVTTARYDAVVIGAGFAGLYLLHSLRDRLGLSVRVYDKASGVGGTWYWNRYPGARSDTESWVYSYSFSRPLLQEWTWSEKYPQHPEVRAYLEHVADRFRLRPDIQFDTCVTRARWIESEQRWEIETDRKERIFAQYLITGLGLLSATNLPALKGLSGFQGEWHHSGAWPKEGVDFSGKRVGVIGTGSTGLQIISTLARQAGQLSVFQRTPQYCVPARNGPLSEAFVAAIKANYDALWQQVRGSAVAFSFVESTVSALQVSAAEREAIFEDAWQQGGGFRFMFGTFNDIATDRRANELACAFIRRKIHEIVKDPAVADRLSPTELHARRPLCADGYFEAYNQDNVHLVDVRAAPIVEITATGIRTADAHYELDSIVFATGFDAVTGNFDRIDIRGQGGLRLKDKWQVEPATYLGVATTGFPNLFMVEGPNGPFSNLPPAIETQVEFITELIAHMRAQKIAVAAVTDAAEAAWMESCRQIAAATLFPAVDSWIFGTNIPGKTRAVMFYLGGLGAYRQQLAASAATDHAGFGLAAVPAAAELLTAAGQQGSRDSLQQ